MRVINGYRHTNNNWPDLGTVMDGGGWGSTGVLPSIVTFDFGQERAISKINVFTVADSIQYTSNPTLADTFEDWGVTAATLEYWNGSSWIVIDSISPNNHVWMEFEFPELEFQLWRIQITSSADGAARLVEVEALGEIATIFERPRSAFIDEFFASRALSNARAYNTEIAFSIHLADDTIIRYGSATIVIDTLSQGSISIPITPLVFSPRVSGKPEFRHTQTKAVDASQFQLVNLDYLITQLIPDIARPFDNAKVIVYLCYPKADGNYEGMIYDLFVITSVEGDDENADISMVSDISARNAMLGMEITQRCQNIFGDFWCGVTHIPLGGECSLIWNDRTGGCLYWGGVFKGVPYINPSGYVPGYYGPPLDPGTGGFEPPIGGGGHCPDPRMWFRSANGGHIRGLDLKAGEAILWNETPGIIEAVEKVHAQYRYLVETATGPAFIGSASHKFLTSYDDDKGMPLHEWKQSFDMIGRSPERGRHMIDGGADNYTIRIAPPGDVLILMIKGSNKYDCGRNKGYTLESHNKPIYGDLTGGGYMV